ncbi:hypothetical protein AB6A40_009858 [Gnathostoma spinigerum]|uniref:Myosin motor domain-containing protein n=1 Tax=Gnathostoma spinigerum TaxID=75299 RepID=A0ABD6F0D5_9BILA
MKRGTDSDWLEKLRNSAHLKKMSHFQLPRFKSPSFIVRHFAADVSYSVEGFMEKNSDTFNEQLVAVVRASKMNLLAEILREKSGKKNFMQKLPVFDQEAKAQNVKKSVASQFRDSLHELMVVLEATRPHYVRCIKPNDEKLPFTFDGRRVIQQLRACGVLETIRISAAGYPSRWNYTEFARRYRVLYPEGGIMWKENPKKLTENVCWKCVNSEMYALGKSKVFFRTAQVAALERLRHETMTNSAITIQKHWKGFVARRRYIHLITSIHIIQAVGRAFIAFRRIKYLQMHRAAICIQTAFRRFIAQKHFKQILLTVHMIQTHYRGWLVRRKVEKLRYEQKTLVIQKYFRGWRDRKEFKERLRKIIIVQCQVRRWLARRELKRLKIEARSVGHLQKLNKGLENKIISLQQRLDLMTDQNSNLLEVCEDVSSLRSQLALLEKERPALLAALKRKEELEREAAALKECLSESARELERLSNYSKEISGQLSKLKEEKIHYQEITHKELALLKSKCEELSRSKTQLSTELNRGI